ncbi:EutP/PduV family microcompartment system protein [Salidesulfovibrio onnuriiensis]|uniref:EutP/PduV family microcompartment system protein n=1 Tax=Salidesulfovibrio onnuriiensis TaxID=2583823 RepID=UPI0011C8ABCD|nr:EutP/PduV family microcompartment system protein [Salidesulfovibrio onnuriiensis]
MKKMMFIGETRVGKSSLIRALSGEEFSSHRAMAVEYFGQYINTPGEFLENSWFYNALITSSADCDILAMVQDATRSSSLFPPLFAPIFNRKVVGVITKVDDPAANTERAERFLNSAGAREVVHTSVRTGTGLDTLREMLR